MKRKTTSHLKENSHYTLRCFSPETLQTRREWQDIFKVMKGKNTYYLGIQPSKVIIQNWRKGSVPDNEKQKGFITTKLALQEVFKGRL